MVNWYVKKQSEEQSSKQLNQRPVGGLLGRQLKQGLPTCPIQSKDQNKSLLQHGVALREALAR